MHRELSLSSHAWRGCWPPSSSPEDAGGGISDCCSWREPCFLLEVTVAWQDLAHLAVAVADFPGSAMAQSRLQGCGSPPHSCSKGSCLGAQPASLLPGACPAKAFACAGWTPAASHPAKQSRLDLRGLNAHAGPQLSLCFLPCGCSSPSRLERKVNGCNRISVMFAVACTCCQRL